MGNLIRYEVESQASPIMKDKEGDVFRGWNTIKYLLMHTFWLGVCFLFNVFPVQFVSSYLESFPHPNGNYWIIVRCTSKSSWISSLWRTPRCLMK